MNPHDVRTAPDGRRDRTCGAPQAVVYRAAQQRSDESFSGNTDQHRAPELREGMQLSYEIEIVLQELTKSDAGIKDDVRSRDSVI